MNVEKFNELVQVTLDSTVNVLCAKSAEYSRGGDKLHNFNRGAAMMGQSREKVLLGFKLKHDISVQDIVNDLDAGRVPSRELVDEKIGDSINYLLLLKACLVERIEGKS